MDEIEPSYRLLQQLELKQRFDILAKQRILLSELRHPQPGSRRCGEPKQDKKSDRWLERHPVKKDKVGNIAKKWF